MEKEKILNLGLIKINDLAKELDVPVSTIRTWKRRGVIPSSCFRKIAGSIFILADKIQEWLYSNECQAS